MLYLLRLVFSSFVILPIAQIDYIITVVLNFICNVAFFIVDILRVDAVVQNPIHAAESVGVQSHVRVCLCRRALALVPRGALHSEELLVLLVHAPQRKQVDVLGLAHLAPEVRQKRAAAEVHARGGEPVLELREVGALLQLPLHGVPVVHVAQHALASSLAARLRLLLLLGLRAPPRVAPGGLRVRARPPRVLAPLIGFCVAVVPLIAVYIASLPSVRLGARELSAQVPDGVLLTIRARSAPGGR